MDIKQSITNYLAMIQSARSKHTYETYSNAMSLFSETFERFSKQSISETDITTLDESFLPIFIERLHDYAPATERLYLTVISGYFEYLISESLSSVNLTKVKQIIRQRSRRVGIRLPQFPRNDIDQILDYLISQTSIASGGDDDLSEHLRFLRDKAFIITLADTGLRVHEACALRRGDIDWNEGRAIIIGKGDKQAVVRFSNRSLKALKAYLHARSLYDGKSGKPLSTLPLFARHDKGAGKKIKSITTTTGRNIVNEWVAKILGQQETGNISPHSFRHYFVTRVLQSSGNLKLAQELARHKNIAVTQRYAHLSDDELDKGYAQAIEDSTA